MDILRTKEDSRVLQKVITRSHVIEEADPVNGDSDSLEEMLALLFSTTVEVVLVFCRLGLVWASLGRLQHGLMQVYRYMKNQKSQGKPMRMKAGIGNQGSQRFGTNT